jgi:RHS repeat-associated protein
MSSFRFPKGRRAPQRRRPAGRRARIALYNRRLRIEQMEQRAMLAPAAVYVDDSWLGTPPGTQPPAPVQGLSFGYNAFAVIQDAIDHVAAGGTVTVYAGNYPATVNVNKGLGAMRAETNPWFPLQSTVHVGGAVLLNAGLVLDGPADVEFGGTVDGPGSLLIQTTGATAFEGAVGATTAPDLLWTFPETTTVFLADTLSVGTFMGDGVVNLGNDQTDPIESQWDFAYDSYLGAMIVSPGFDLTLDCPEGAVVIGDLTGGRDNNVTLSAGTDIWLGADASNAWTGLAALTLSAGTTYVYAGSVSAQSITCNGSASLEAAAVTISCTSDSIFSGVVADGSGGPGSLVKAGPGTLTLAGANTYSGGTTIHGGLLLVNNTTGSGTGTGSVTVNNGARLGGGGRIAGAVTVNSGGTIDPDDEPEGTAILAEGDLMVSPGGKIRAQISGPAAGMGYDQLYVTGSVSIGGATLALSRASGFVSAPGSQFVLIANDGTDPVNGTFAGLPEGATVSVGGVRFTIGYHGGDGNDVVLSYVAPASVYVDDDWSGTPIGATPATDPIGGLVFGYTAFATIQDAIDHVEPMGSVTVYGGDYPGPVNVNKALEYVEVRTNPWFPPGWDVYVSGTVTLNADLTVGGPSDMEISGTVSGPGALVKADSGTLILAGNNTYRGGTVVSAGTLQVSTASLPGNVANHGTLIFDQPTDGTYAATISGSGAVVKDNTGTLTLAGDNTYTGPTAINGGVLRLQRPSLTITPVNNSFETPQGPFTPYPLYKYSPSGAGVGWSFNPDAGINRNGGPFYSPPAPDGNQGAFLQGPDSNFSQDIDFAVCGRYTVSFYAVGRTGAQGPNDFKVQFDGADVMTVPVGSLSTTAWQLFASPEFSVSRGTHTLKFVGIDSAGGDRSSCIDKVLINLAPGADLLPDGSLVAIASGACLDLNGLDETIGPLSGQGSVTLGAGALTVNSTSDSTFAGVLADGGAGSGSLVKTAAGTLALAAPSTYTGGTTVAAGTLLVNNTTGSGTGTGSVTVNDGARLGGAGRISGPVTVNSGGTIDPDDEPEGTAILAEGDLMVAPGGTVRAQINGPLAGTGYDQLDVTGSVDLGAAALDAHLGAGFAPATGSQFVLVANDGADPVSGAFAGLAEGATVVVGAVHFTISYRGGDGNDVVLTCAYVSGSIHGLKFVAADNRVYVRHGVPDHYLPGNPEPASPSPGLLKALTGHTPLATYDGTTVNKFFGDTFRGIPAGVWSASLWIGLKPIGELSRNDTIFVGVYDNATGAAVAVQSYNIGNPNGANYLYNGAWDTPHVRNGKLFTIPLTNAVIAAMKQQGKLDVWLQDDTAVDFAELSYNTFGPGMPEVTITLKDSQNQAVATTITGVDGTYHFTDLPPGTYTVTETVPTGWWPATATSYTVTVHSGEELVAEPGQAHLPPGDPRREVVLDPLLAFGNYVPRPDPLPSPSGLAIEVTPLISSTASAWLRLTWDPSFAPDGYVDHYVVYRNGEVLAIVPPTDGPSYVDADVQPSTAYSYQISAVGREGLASDLSGPVTGIYAAISSYSAPSPVQIEVGYSEPIDHMPDGWYEVSGRTVQDVSLSPDQCTATVTLSSSTPLAVGNSYTLTVTNATTVSGHAMPATQQFTFTYQPQGTAGTGSILVETWANIPGTAVSDLTDNPNFPYKPSSTSNAATFDAPPNSGDNYGTMVQGYVCPPVSGDYVFWIAADETAELWLSTDEDSANRVLIATVPGPTGLHEWGKYAAQQSAPVWLGVGRKYYIRALQKEGTGSDNLSVAWQVPGTTFNTATGPSIAGVYLVPFDVPPAVYSITRAGVSPTKASSVQFVVNFTEAVTGVDPTDFTVALTGTTTCTLRVLVAGGGATYTVTVNGISGSGTLGLNLMDDDSVVDLSGNPLSGIGTTGPADGSFTGGTYTIDTTAPTASITRSGMSPTNANSLKWTVTFSEPVTGVDTGDFSLALGGLAATVTSVTGSGASYSVTATVTGAGQGTVGLNLVDNNSILDAVRNPLGGPAANDGDVTGPVYSVDTAMKFLAYWLKPVAGGTADYSVTGAYTGGDPSAADAYTVSINSLPAGTASIKFELYASISGANANFADDAFVSGILDILNAPTAGNPLAGQPNPVTLADGLNGMDGANASGGQVSDVNGDGSLDLGGPLSIAVLPGTGAAWVRPYNPSDGVAGTGVNSYGWTDVLLGTFVYTFGSAGGALGGQSAQLRTAAVTYTGGGSGKYADMWKQDGAAQRESDGNKIGAGPAVTIAVQSVVSVGGVGHVEGNSGTTDFVFPVTLSVPCAQTVQVTVDTADGTATVADNDYQALHQVLTFAPGETAKTVTVRVNGDTKIEPDETFTVVLSNATGGASLGTATSAAGTVVNDDFAPAIVYVDDDWAGTAPGDPPPTDPIGGLIFMQDAFATIQDAIDHVMANGEVVVFGGNYPGGFTLGSHEPPTVHPQTNPWFPPCGVVVAGPVVLGTSLAVAGPSDMEITGPLSGPGALVKSGSGTLILGGENTSTGGTTLDAGTLVVSASAGQLGLGTVALNSGTLVLPSGAFAPWLTVGGDAAIELAVGAIATFPGLTMGAARLSVVGGPASLAIIGSTTLTGSAVFEVGAGSTLSLAGIAELCGPFGFSKTGSGSLELAGPSTYNGPTAVMAGTLRLAAGSLPDSSPVSIAAGATLDLNGMSASIGSLDGEGNVVLGGGTLTVDSTSDSTFAGTISGVGGLAKLGPATLVLAGVNTYTGPTIISAGTVRVGAPANCIPDSGPCEVLAGATLDLNGYNETIGPLDGDGSVALGTGSLTVNSTSDSAFSGTISGAGALAKMGPARLELTGTNTYAAGTFVLAGTLQAGAVEAFPTHGSLDIAAGATAVLAPFINIVQPLAWRGNDLAPLNDVAQDPQDVGQSVSLYGGAAVQSVVDLAIPGRGFDWTLARTYRSDVTSSGVLGHNWELNYERRLRVVTAANRAAIVAVHPTVKIGDVVHFNGAARQAVYVVNYDGSYTPPAGFYTKLVKKADGTFVERQSDGMTAVYAPPDDNGVAILAGLCDRNGNTMFFEYNDLGQLSRVADTLDRPIDYLYQEGRLAEVRDFAGRSVRFQYDASGDLVAVTSPAVTGTPNGNDFPNGKTTRYAYAPGHKLLSVTAPNEVATDGPARVVFSYDTDPASWNFGRVLSQTLGGLNASGVPCGGTIAYQYAWIGAPLGQADLDTAVRQTAVTDRNGNRTEYQFNQLNNTVRVREFTNRDVRPGDPEYFDTRYYWNKDYAMVQKVLPEGNTISYTYDTANPDRFQQGNLLAEVRQPDAARGGDQTAITTSFRYEPMFNQVWQATEARGNTTTYSFDYQESNDVGLLAAQLGVTEAAVRQLLAAGGVSINLGDLNADGVIGGARGNVVRADYPSVLLPDGTTQQIVELYGYNQFGQKTREVDPEGNVDEYEYFGEADPDGDGVPTGGVAWRFDFNAAASPTEPGFVGVLPTDNYTAARGFGWDSALTGAAQGAFDRGPVPGAQGAMREDGHYSGAPHTFRADVTNGTYSVKLTVGDAAAPHNHVRVKLNGVVVAADVNTAAGQWTTLTVPAVVVTNERLELGICDWGGEPSWVINGLEIGRTLDPLTGGYLKSVVRDTASGPQRDSGTDPTPTNIRTQYGYDTVGNVTRAVDGRGIATDYVVNQLNEVVQITRAAAHGLFALGVAEPLALTDYAYLERIAYDFNGNVVLRQLEDRGNTSAVDGNLPAPDLPAVAPNPDPIGGPAFADTVFKYDLWDQQIEMLQEVANGVAAEAVRTRSRYDPNGNPVLIIQPEGNATRAYFDERDLAFRTGRGALTPPPVVLLGPSDPTTYDVRGGLPCVCVTYRYDGNGNVIETSDADDTDLSAANNSDYGGYGDRTRFLYDGFDRQTSVIDATGNQTVYQYDSVGNVVRMLHFGPVGGLSPSGDGPDVLAAPVSSAGVVQSANLVSTDLLDATENSYDELARLFQTDKVLFVNTISTLRAPDVADGAADLGKGDLTIGDNQAVPGVAGVTIIGRVTQRMGYDRNSRVTSTVQDDGDTSRTFFDGAGRVLKTLDPEGNAREYAYDGNGNVIETRQTDVAQVPGVATEVFLTTNFYDSLNRLQQRVDNLGQTTYYRFDSRDNLVAVADAQGPLSGASIGRRAFPSGPRTINAINDFGNVTLYTCDGMNRQVRQETILTASGQGDGIRCGATFDGVKTEPPTPDPDQGGGDGIIRTGRTYDDNSLPSAEIDDQGNVTLYIYDNLDRRVAETKGLTVATTPLTKAAVFGAREIVGPTAATINDPYVIPAAKIDAQLAAAKTRLNAVASLFPPLADRIDDHPPTTIVYGYSPDDNLLIVEDENDSETFTRYDALNRPVAVRVFRAGQSDSFADDPLFAPAPLSDPSNPSIAFPAVVGTTKQDFQYDGLSRQTRATDNNDPVAAADDSVVTRAYDSLGRMIEETQQIGSLPAQAVDSAWRAEGLRKALTYPNGRVEFFAYDRLDRLNAVLDAGAALPIVEYDYIGEPRVLVRACPVNGTRTTYLNDSGTIDVGYDGLGRPVQLRALRDDNSLIVGFGHVYDRMGNKLSEAKMHDAANSEVYGYDSAYRLVHFARPNPGAIAPLQSEWTLDGANNWQQVDGETREHSSFNEIIQRTDSGMTTLTCDDNGNETDDGTLAFTWDFLNRLRTVTRKSDGVLAATYSYDAAGRRTCEVVTNSGALSGTTCFYLDISREIEEHDGADVLVQQYVYGNYVDELLAMDRNLDGDGTATGPADGRLFYHQNTLFSNMALTDAAGNILEGYQYDAYGCQTVFVPGANGQVDFGADDAVTVGGVSHVANSYLFTGRRLDGESMLYYCRTRYLNATQGRFISRDTIGVWADAENRGNGYTYAGDRPVQALDPSGERCGGICKAAKKVGKFFKETAQKVVQFVKDLPGVARSAAQEVGKAVKKLANKLPPSVKRVVRAIAEDVKLAVEGLVDFAKEIFEGIKKLPTMLREGIQKQRWPYSNWYGNWCGPGGAGKAIDDLDACCREHDVCYIDTCGYPRWTAVLIATPKKLSDLPRDEWCLRKCDRELAQCAITVDCRWSVGCIAARPIIAGLFATRGALP